MSSSAPFGTVNVGLPQMAMGRQEALIRGGNYVRLSKYPETHQGRRLSRAVGRLEFLRADGRIGYCTASIISQDYILTNHHCLPGKDKELHPVRAQLLMNYYDESRASAAFHYEVDVRPVEASSWPDYSILRVAGNPAARFGALSMPIAAPLPGEPLIMFHHPQAQPMVLSAKGCLTADQPVDGNSQLIHYCDTDEGSSGAPILDVNGTRLIGLHYSGTPRFNLAIPMTRLRQTSAVLAQLFPDQSPPPIRRAEETAPLASAGPVVFRDCPDCPEMVVLPKGEFVMGSPKHEEDRWDNEAQHKVTMGYALAVGRYEVTFAQWEACVAGGGCTGNKVPADKGWGRGPRPVIDVSWNDAQAYVAWLSQRTGQKYRLLSEAEWEYAARGGTSTRYWWGDDIGRNNANCDGCGSQWDNRMTAPVGSFKPNQFGLYDMHGNVEEWGTDCWHHSYKGAPSDGSAWTAGECMVRVVRGGSWLNYPRHLRSANRGAGSPVIRSYFVGFRVARTVTP